MIRKKFFSLLIPLILMVSTSYCQVIYLDSSYIKIDRNTAVKINKAFAERDFCREETKILNEYLKHKDSTIVLLEKQIQNYSELSSVYEKSFKEVSLELQKQSSELSSYKFYAKQQKKRTLFTSIGIAAILGILIIVR